MERRVKIRAMGSYLPRRIVHSTELDEKLGLRAGTLEKLSGVQTRYYADEKETSSTMGAYAGMSALENAGLKFEDVDAIVCASGTYEQPIPCTAALIQRAFGKEESGTSCFDINSTCLGFVVGLDVVSSMIDSGRWRRALLISTDIASVGLPWHQHEACALFGDGAVAAVIEKTPEGDTARVFGAHQETFSSGADICEITGGGTRVHPRHHEVDDKRFMFSMDGRRVFRQASQKLPGFLENFEKKIGFQMNESQMVIPHQASGSAMEIMRRKLGVSEKGWMNIIAKYGNMIAASIPLALKLAIDEGKVKRGDKVSLIGTSAGFSIGALALEY
jgi:3-oxoacyl-[acyl-carrier-protein] synthase III